MAALEQRRQWAIVVAIIGSMIASVALHIWWFNHLETINCVGFWEPRYPDTPEWNKHWPRYCYWNRISPGQDAVMAGLTLWMGVWLAAMSLFKLFMFMRHKAASTHLRSAAGLAVGAAFGLWLWREYFTITLP